MKLYTDEEIESFGNPEYIMHCYKHMNLLGLQNHLQHEREKKPHHNIAIVGIIQQLIQEKVEYLNSITE